MNPFRKKLTVPESNATKQIDVAQTWEVRWTSIHVTNLLRSEERYTDPVIRVEVFLSQEEAQIFAESLTRAKSLLRDEHRKEVAVIKSKSV